MPHVTRKQQDALNRSYAYVVSGELATTVPNLRDGLVQSGFERLETKDLILTQSDEDPTTDLFTPRTDLIIPLPDIDESVVLPDSE
ncbi:hypothetical protein, partial [Pseudomonas viridiflava]|uniref:hypothetical protein n=1 Tax=Pseudomonas viridiflava TaxID=33069 RepID=UPI0019D0F6DF